MLLTLIILAIQVVVGSKNKQAKPFAPFPLQKLQHYYDLVRHSRYQRTR